VSDFWAPPFERCHSIITNVNSAIGIRLNNYCIVSVDDNDVYFIEIEAG